jgi:hypothetical protein
MFKVASGAGGAGDTSVFAPGEGGSEDDSAAEPGAKRPKQAALPAGGVGGGRGRGRGGAAAAGPMGALMSAVAARGLQLEWNEGALALRLPPSRAPQVCVVC